MKKFIFFAFAVVGAVIAKSAMDRAEREKVEGRTKRRLPRENFGRDAEQETRSQISEV